MPITFNLDLAPPGTMNFDIMGGVTVSPTNENGDYGVANFGGSGIVVAEYSDIDPGNVNRNGLKYMSRLKLLNGGRRSIIVPLITDFFAPISDSVLNSGNFVEAVTFDDGATFDDGSTFEQAVVSGAFTATGALNASTINFVMYGGETLVGGEWFSINHPNRSHRAYMITDIDATGTDGNGNTTYTCGIRPNLREAVSSGDPMEWIRPKCLMVLQPGTTIDFDIKHWWSTKGSIKFQEAPRYGTYV